jgi:hypothetical protein
VVPRYQRYRNLTERFPAMRGAFVSGVRESSAVKQLPLAFLESKTASLSLCSGESCIQRASLAYIASGISFGTEHEDEHHLTRRCSGLASLVAELIRWVVQAHVAPLLSIRTLVHVAMRLFGRPRETVHKRARVTFCNFVRLRRGE